MARTKQTARKSTSGPAPRLRLASGNNHGIGLQRHYRERAWREEEASQPKRLSRKRLLLSNSPEPPTTPAHRGIRDLRPVQQAGNMRYVCGRQTWLMGERKKSLETEKESQPEPLSRARGRRLSVAGRPYVTRQRARLESEPAATIEHNEDENRACCMLLKDIPLEIREIIFGLVLGTDAIFHLVSRVKRVGHIKCSKKLGGASLSTCYCSTTLRNARYSSPRQERENTKTSHIELALLQTCRQAYREGIHLLYSRPVFEVEHPETLNWFARTVRPQRLAAITKLNISLGEAAVDWEIPMTQQHPFRVKAPTTRRARNDGDLLRYWDPAWRTILCEMTSLKHLTVTLIGKKYDDHEYAEPVLKPLLELRGLITFGLRLEGESRNGNEAARLENLKERSDTLRTILQSATSESSGTKRKAKELNWGPPQNRKKRRKKRNWY